MKKITTMLVLAFVMCASSVFAQTRSISGTVLSADNNSPVIGATVIVGGSQNGSVTGTNGQFTIQGVDGAVTLNVACLGFEPKSIAISASETYATISLTPQSLRADEVVVTGLGISREKKALGYAVQDLSAEDLVGAGNSNVITSLQGKVTGVDIKPSSGMPGASSQIVIRGARSFAGNNQPLYVIDGMPISSGSDIDTEHSVTSSDFSNRAIDIDPNDIETMNILKGQAASALYGIRASNGVIVITTKSGKRNGNGRVNVNVSNTTSFDVISRTPDVQTEYAQGYNGNYAPINSFSWGPKISDLPTIGGAYGGNANDKPGKFYVSQLASAGLDPWATPAVYDNIGDFFQQGFTTNSSASVSQSKDGYSYYVSLNNTKQQGIIESTGMVRSGARINASTKLGKSWNTGFSGSYNQTNIDKTTGANDAILAQVYGAPPSYNLKGTPFADPNNPYSQINYRAGSFNNPYWAMEHNNNGEKTSRFFGNTYIEFAPDYNWSHNQKISVKYQVGVDTYDTNYDDIIEFGSGGNSGKITNRAYNNSTYNSLITATYNVDLSSDFKLDLLIGNEMNHSNQRMVTATGQNFNFGGWAHLGNATIQTARDYRSKERTMGFFGNLNLSYKNMLYLGATVRNDIVSEMPNGNRSFTYPSVSLGYIFSEHEGLKDSDILNFAKLRLSYAEVGQTDRYYRDFYSIPSYGGGFWGYAPISYPFDGTTSYAPYPVMYDPNLKPQNTVSYEGGFDLHMFNSILELSYTFSRQNVKDQIFAVPLAPSTGYQERVMNGGRIHTNAHEITAIVNLVQAKDWDWSVTANFTKMDNYVDELAPGVESIMLGGFVTPQVRAGTGDKFPVIYGVQFQKDINGNILVNTDEKSAGYGMPMAGAPGVIGDVSQNFNLGFGTALRWKDISLRATFDYKNGGQMYSGTNGLMDLYGTSAATSDRTSKFVYDGVIPTKWETIDGVRVVTESKPNDIVRGGAEDLNAHQYLYTTALDVDEAYIYDNDFLKLREINISYKIKATKDFTIGVNVFARNILLWTELPNLDPESSQGNNNMGGAFERFSLPQTSSYGLGVNLSF